MQKFVGLERRYKVSEDIVTREIEGEIILIPLSAGVGDLEDELYTLNDTAYSFWKRLDGQRSLAEIISELQEEYEASPDTLQEDISGLVEELLKRKILVEVP